MARILVVEDDEALNEVLQYNLGRAGYEVVWALDGIRAVEELDSCPPDLVLLDIMLPGKNGWQICAHMASSSQLEEVPVIIFTAKSSREDYDRAREFPNFAGYFVKPYATSDVLRHLEKVLSDGS